MGSMNVVASVIMVATLLVHNSHAAISPDQLQLASITGVTLEAKLNRLAQYSTSSRPSVTRLVFSDEDIAARKHIKQWMAEAGLAIREDIMGNIFACWEGQDPHAGVVMTGSHADSIVLGGAYDGALGVVGAIEAVRALKEEGFKPLHPVEVIMFTTEEGSRFDSPCLGSQGVTGWLTEEFLAKFLDENGTDFRTASNYAGYPAKTDKELLAGAKLADFGAIEAFVELHIEQGPLLEAEGKQVGIVTDILAPSLVRVNLTGNGGHGGGMPMSHRNDPSLAAAEVALKAEQAALATGAFDTVATAGGWRVTPNIFNAVPRGAVLDIDIRDTDTARRDFVIQSVKDAMQEIARKRRLNSATFEVLYKYPVAKSSPKVLSAIEAATQQLGLSTKHMVSRPYHDAGFMAQVAPTAMIFSPCRRGLSHHPEEFVEPQDLENAVKTLALTIARLAKPAIGADSQDRVEL